MLYISRFVVQDLKTSTLFAFCHNNAVRLTTTDSNIPMFFIGVQNQYIIVGLNPPLL